MSDSDAVARAVLYEGYLLYPYGKNTIKNRQRFTFGGLYPPAFDPATMQTECLLEGDASATVSVVVRFLQLLPTGEAIEREVAAPGRIDVAPIEGLIEVDRAMVEPAVHKITVRIANSSAFRPKDRDEALLHSMLSTHTLLKAPEGAFVSLTDPPERLRAAAAACRNLGSWPVLVGEPGARDAMLSSPIILEDYPRVAEQSRGDFFDATEVDELLSLSIMSLTDEEKADMREDPHTRLLLERTESLSADELMKLHGVMRGARLLREDGP